MAFARVHWVHPGTPGVLAILLSVLKWLSVRVYYAHDRAAAVLVPLRTAWLKSTRIAKG
jgi:hypothetical protein